MPEVAFCFVGIKNKSHNRNDHSSYNRIKCIAELDVVYQVADLTAEKSTYGVECCP